MNCLKNLNQATKSTIPKKLSLKFERLSDILFSHFVIFITFRTFLYEKASISCIHFRPLFFISVSQCRLEYMWSNCERLDMLAGKEPLARRQNAKIRVDQLKYDLQHLNSSLQSQVRNFTCKHSK